MSATTVDETVERVLKPIQQFTRGWMMTGGTAQRGVDIGMASGEDFWICGRAGVLGDCDADVAAAGLAFIAPERVRLAWDGLPDGLTHRQVSDEYARCCTAWGAEVLSTFDEARMARLDELGRRVADAAPAALGAVFAGWRAMPQPPATPGRAALTTQVLREMRGAAHIVAIQACGLSPLEAVLVSPAAPPRTGPAWAEHLGWTGPFADADDLREARLRAEELTSAIMARHISVLDAEERDEFAEIVETTRNAIDM
jgi:hypothetical protein